MPSAIVTGATGILGREIVFELAKNPSQWSTIHALSRSKKADYPANVKHGRIDLTGDVNKMAKDLEGMEAEYVFFAAYLQQDTEQENWDVNGDMLHNFLDALKLTGADRKVQRILLVTGVKQYGVHLGVPKNPMEETDPWLRGPEWPPNFYYRQQDILKEYSERSSWDWVVTYPNDVIGVAKGNFMNATTTLGLYVAVTKEMGQELYFPGSDKFYTMFDCFTDTRLHAQFCAWAALEPGAGNQAFNVVNGDVESWQNLWPKVARRFGVKIPEDQFAKPSTEGGRAKMQDQPPLSAWAKEMGLVGQTAQSMVEHRIDLVRWSQREDVKKAWERLAEREGLDQEAFGKETWWFLGFVLGRDFNIVVSMSKAREFGWTGYMDTWQSLSETLDELEKLKVLPKSK
ncbi:hypothetical protein AJ80_00141 [Polytolypa hystricis UAMH7299]|uniref:Uncharacterized protein n=1 Tax=Polytolypa hystricis (strain UAMH7299) TaxID=1447883 RepID=A0A2B7Z4B8_POLH7|nr:hypothetical protein AJ80_00141 [Polytolypa hystricis UAMH7299]